MKATLQSFNRLLPLDPKQLRFSVSAQSLQTSSNPLSGRGFTQVLDLAWFPERHVWVQLVHCVQYPLTNDKRSERETLLFFVRKLFCLVNCSAPSHGLLRNRRVLLGCTSFVRDYYLLDHIFLVQLGG